MGTFAVITSPCIGIKDGACVQVCPVDCIQEGPDQFFVHPEECIICGLCLAACPTNAIFASDDLPQDQTPFIKKAQDFFGL